jgi:hypothetical protein
LIIDPSTDAPLFRLANLAALLRPDQEEKSYSVRDDHY